jgi:hypothetical protein
MLLHDHPGGPDAVELRHVKIHQHDIGPQPRDLGDRGFAVLNDADDLKRTGLLDEELQHLTLDFRVLDQQQANHARRLTISSRLTWLKPDFRT